MVSIEQVSGSDSVVSQNPRNVPFGTAIESPQVTGGSSSGGSFYDSETVETTSATVSSNWQITKDFGVTLVNTTPSIASLDANDYLTRTTDGVALIKCVNGAAFSWLKLNVTQAGGSTATTFNGYTPETVAATLADAMTGAWDLGGTLPFYSTINQSTGTFVKSATCWAKDYDLTGLAVSLATTGTNWSQANSPTAVTPRHAVLARHFQTVTKGVSKARFVDSNGAVLTRTITGISDPLAGGSLDDDLVVVTLDSDLPETVTPLAVAGDWMRQAVTSTGGNAQQPGRFYAGGYGFTINQNFQAIGVTFGSALSLSYSFVLADVTYDETPFPDIVSSIQVNSGNAAYYSVFDQLDGYEDFLVDVASGDSGKPIFADVSGDPVLVAIFTLANSGTLVGVQDGDVVNALIANADADAGVSTGYTVTVTADPTL